MSTAKKLPKLLPALPPVPKGYDSWELCGWGGLKMKPDGTPWGCANRDFMDWDVASLSKFHALGFKSFYYIRAVKRPAKRKNPKPSGKVYASVAEMTADLSKPNQAKAVKAVRLWSCAELEPVPVFSRKAMLPKAAAYFVLPADKASVDQMVEQGANALMAAWNCNLLDEESRVAYRHDARVLLASLGITSTKSKK